MLRLAATLAAVTSCAGAMSSGALAQPPAAVSAIEQRITEAEVQTLAQELVRIRSDYDEGVLANHKEMADFLAGRLRALGMDVHVFEPTPNYPTVIGRLKGTAGKPTLGMMAHYNTVTVGDASKWTVDPFGGVVKDGKIYGLGASDQKMPMAAALTAVKAIVDSGTKLRGDLMLLFIPGEGAQVHSLPMIVRDHPEVLRADWVLDTEGGPDITRISGGWVWAKLTVEGITGHTAGRRAGGENKPPVNAIFRLARLLTELEDPDRWMKYEKHPLFALPLYGGKPVIEVGKIEGGHKVNQVPDRAEAQLDIRLLPGQTPEGVLSELRAVIARQQKSDPELKASVEIMTQQWVPMKYWNTLSDDDPLVKAIREVAPPILGHMPGWSGSIGGGRPDIWATGAKWISWGGGGGGGNAHAPDEYASIEGGVTRAKLYARLIMRVIGPQGGSD
jgi:succinyl-diaminopimelate desuccinylase